MTPREVPAAISTETDWEGSYHLSGSIVASPWADDRLYQLAVFERAAATAMPAAALTDAVPTELASDLRLAALDLAGFDGRYALDVLDAAAHRAVAAWAEAIDGDRRPLAELVGGASTTRLLHPDSDRRRRQVIRGPRLRQLRIVSLRPTDTLPATITVDATITARRYHEHRATGAVVAGRREHDTIFSVRFDLALSDDPNTPWRIVNVRLDRPRFGLWTFLTRQLPLEVYEVISEITGRPR